MIKYLQTYPIRHALSIGLAVVVAVFVNHYFSYSKEGWMILTAFLLNQTTRGTPLKQGSVYFVIIILIALMWPNYDPDLVRDRMLDIFIGAVIGVIFGQLLFPVRLYAEFSLGVLPVLEALMDYSKMFTHHFLQHSNNRLLVEKKWEIEAALSTRRGMYPEWVYEIGFNPGLRSGYRYFLINLENVTEIFFSMSYFSSLGLDASLLADLSQYLTQVMQKNEELLQVLMNYFDENKLKRLLPDSDFTSDISELEEALNQLLPGSLDLLETSSDYLILTGLVRDLKDLRGLLLQLVMSLPAAESSRINT